MTIHKTSKNRSYTLPAASKTPSILGPEVIQKEAGIGEGREKNYDIKNFEKSRLQQKSEVHFLTGSFKGTNVLRNTLKPPATV